MTIQLENPHGSGPFDRVEKVLDAVRRLPDRPAPAPSPALAAFLAAPGLPVEILDSGDELAARRARRGRFAAKVALAAACLTATGVAAAGAVTGVGPVPRLPVLERHAPAEPKAPKAPVEKASAPVKRSSAGVVTVKDGGDPVPSTVAADDGPGLEARHRRHHKRLADGDRGRFSKAHHGFGRLHGRTGDDDRADNRFRTRSRQGQDKDQNDARHRDHRGQGDRGGRDSGGHGGGGHHGAHGGGHGHH